MTELRGVLEHPEHPPGYVPVCPIYISVGVYFVETDRHMHAEG